MEQELKMVIVETLLGDDWHPYMNSFEIRRGSCYNFGHISHKLHNIGWYRVRYTRSLNLAML